MITYSYFKPCKAHKIIIAILFGYMLVRILRINGDENFFHFTEAFHFLNIQSLIYSH